jgi:hypothetical protein
MSEINYNIGLCGEFRLTVLDNKTVISDTGWCKNTILSGGLAYLADNSLLQSLNYIEFGTDGSNVGDYTLAGVMSPCLNTELANISSNNIQYYPVNKSTQVYYSTYSSSYVTARDEVISEFCIKTIDKTGFSRAVLPIPVTVSVGQNVNFEYRVSVDYNNENISNVEFVTYDGSSFFIPVTSKVFNLPNFDNDLNKAGRLIDDYPMVLLQNNEDLPSFGDTYPATEIYAINNSQQQSTFAPSIVYSDIDYNSRSYSVITEYMNLSAPPNSGIFENINTALLKYKNDGVILSRFQYPLALYSTSLYYNPSVINSSNLISLYYKYTWSETLTSTFQTPTTFTLSAPQLIPCNINLFVDLFPNSFLTIHSNNLTAPNAPGNTSIIRVSLLSSYLYNINIDYFSPDIDSSAYQYGPSPYKIIVFDNNNDPISNTGYVFPDVSKSWSYNTAPFDSLNYYNDKLRRLSNETISGSISGTTLLTNISVGSDRSYIDVLVNSPFVGTSWTIVLDTMVRESTPLPLPEEITLIDTISGIAIIEDGTFESIITNCNQVFSSGGQGVQIIPIEFGTYTGWFGISYNAYTVPDKFDISWNGNMYTSKYVGEDGYNNELIEAGVPLSSINTASPGNGTGTLYIYKPLPTPSQGVVTVTGPLAGTAWQVGAICPGTSDPTSTLNLKTPQYDFGPGIPLSAGPVITDILGIWAREGWVNDKPYYTNYNANGSLIWSVSSWKITIGNNIVFISEEDTEDITTISLWENEGNPYTINIDGLQLITTTMLIDNIANIDNGTLSPVAGILTVTGGIISIGSFNDGALISKGLTVITNSTIDNIGNIADGSFASSVISTTGTINGNIAIIENGAMDSPDKIFLTSFINYISQADDGSLESDVLITLENVISYISTIDNGSLGSTSIQLITDLITNLATIDDSSLISNRLMSIIDIINYITSLDDGTFG